MNVLAACQDNVRCECFTYFQTSNGCSEYSDCESLNQTCSTCLSGLKDCPVQLLCNQQGFCNGHIDGEPEFLPDEEACLDKCKADANCEWYSYNKNTGACTLLRDCPFLDLTCTECSSGQRDCPLNGKNALHPLYKTRKNS